MLQIPLSWRIPHTRQYFFHFKKRKIKGLKKLVSALCEFTPFLRILLFDLYIQLQPCCYLVNIVDAWSYYKKGFEEQIQNTVIFYLFICCVHSPTLTQDGFSHQRYMMELNTYSTPNYAL